MEKIFFVLLSLGLLLRASVASAICPICTIAVGAGVGLAQWFGIDDTISGVWIGGLTVSMIVWTINWLNKKHWSFKGYKSTIVLAYYLLIVAPLYYTGLIGHPYNMLWGMDKLLVGIVVGSLVFLGTVRWYEYLKKQNHGHAHFPFEKVVLPVSAFFIFSLIFYFITR
jgi:hypothetical protein